MHKIFVFLYGVGRPRLPSMDWCGAKPTIPHVVGYGTPDAQSFCLLCMAWASFVILVWTGVARGLPFHKQPFVSTLAHLEQAVELDLLYMSAPLP